LMGSSAILLLWEANIVISVVFIVIEDVKLVKL
jgi:hypothetical protein